jgi:hypothetical protein
MVINPAMDSQGSMPSCQVTFLGTASDCCLDDLRGEIPHLFELMGERLHLLPRVIGLNLHRLVRRLMTLNRRHWSKA